MTRLLVVEDDALLLRTLVAYLGSFPGEFELLAASRVGDALALIGSQPLDLVLADVRLPNGDGIDFLRRALAIAPHLKVVVMTAQGSADVRARAFAAGARRFLDKPLDLGSLRRTLLSLA